MSNSIIISNNFGAVSSVFGGSPPTNDELGAGVASSYAVIGYKGKVWSIRHQGDEKILMRDDGDGPRNSIEVVLLKASPAISKIFYRAGYVDGSTSAPDCWSANGQTPDGSVQNKVNPTCADCPMNAWGSRTTEAGKQGKACADSRRVAVVPVSNIANEMFGGPILLRVPAASLKDLKAYGDALNSYQYPYYAVATRIAFNPQEAYPKFEFTAIRPLSDEEGKLVLELRDDKRTKSVLSETIDPAAVQAAVQAAAQAAVPASPFEVDQRKEQEVTAQVTPQTAPQTAPQRAQGGFSGFGATAPADSGESPSTRPAAAPSTNPPPTTAQDVPEDFDALLGNLLGSDPD